MTSRAESRAKLRKLLVLAEHEINHAVSCAITDDHRAHCTCSQRVADTALAKAIALVESLGEL